MRSEGFVLIVGVLVASAGCMSGEDYSAVLTGERPRAPVARPGAMVDVGPADVSPVDVALADPDMCAPSDEVCNGRDDDCNGRVDDMSDSPLGEICCSGPDLAEADAIRCGDAPDGLLLAPGWAFVRDDRGDPLLVTVEPIDVEQWCSVEWAVYARDLCVDGPGPAACPGDDAAPWAETDAVDVDLYKAAAFANGWSCGRGQLPCYTLDGRTLQLTDVSGSGPLSGPLEQRGACGARLVGRGMHDAVTARAGADGRCDAGCDLAGADARIAGFGGLERWLTGREWVWPDAGAVSADDSIPLAGCGRSMVCPGGPSDCGSRSLDPRGAGDSDVARRAGFRLACPAVFGERSRCTEPGMVRGQCL